MALVPKIDPNKIFASNAPSQDKPAAFDNYEKGMDETRKNLGRPTIPQLNYLHQTADQKNLYIHQNGAALPYDATMEYAENAVTVKDGELKQLVDGAWVEVKTKALPATSITTSSSQNQQQINDFGGATWYSKAGGYKLGATIKLANGDIVKSTVAGNAIDPNVDMTGWRFDNDVVNSIAELLAIQNPKDGQCVAVTSYNPVNYELAEPYFPKGGGLFEYNSALSSRNDGGVVIDGWVRQDTTNLNAYDFGCYGNWHATNQTGADDTVPLQKYIDYVCNKPSLRQGGVRVARLRGGNYRISALNISKYWGFTLLGEKYFTNIWVDPTGTGIDVSVEGSNFKDITFNGKLNASYHSVSDPGIDYIFKFKLTNSAFDIDTAFTDCNVAWAKNFARVSGRGFNWVGGGVGQTVGSLCDIACDADLTPSGSDQYQLTQTVMRHYKFENARCDQLGAVFNIIGTNAVKEYINGIKVTGCDLVGVNRVISSLDCRIVKPLLANNKGYGGFTNIISVPRAVEVQDIGNDWNPVPSIDSLVTTHKIPSAYVFSDSLDGFTLMSNIRNVSNNLILVGQGSMSGQVNGSGNVKNVTITGSKIKNFSDGLAWANVINNTGTSKNISIQGNTLTSDVSTRKRWLANVTDHKSIQIKDNITDGAGFDPQELTYTPSVLVDGVVPGSGLTITISEGKYRIIDDYVECDVLIGTSATPLTGVLSVSLPPIPAVIINSSLSSRISGFGQVEQSFNTGITALSVEVWTTTQAATLRNQNTDYNLTSKANPAITFSAKFKYRFK